MKEGNESESGRNDIIANEWDIADEDELGEEKENESDNERVSDPEKDRDKNKDDVLKDSENEYDSQEKEIDEEKENEEQNGSDNEEYSNNENIAGKDQKKNEDLNIVFNKDDNSNENESKELPNSNADAINLVESNNPEKKTMCKPENTNIDNSTLLKNEESQKQVITVKQNSKHAEILSNTTDVVLPSLPIKKIPKPPKVINERQHTKNNISWAPLHLQLKQQKQLKKMTIKRIIYFTFLRNQYILPIETSSTIKSIREEISKEINTKKENFKIYFNKEWYDTSKDDLMIANIVRAVENPYFEVKKLFPTEKLFQYTFKEYVNKVLVETFPSWRELYEIINNFYEINLLTKDFRAEPVTEISYAIGFPYPVYIIVFIMLLLNRTSLLISNAIYLQLR